MSQHGHDHVRASDADRDQVAAVLADALAEGRLTPVEHSERMDAVYAAKTIGDLAPITRDLPAAGQGMPAREGTFSSPEALDLAQDSQGRENIVAAFGGAQRTGRWLVEPRTNVSLVCGGADLDFRDAVLSQREVTIQCAILFGGLSMTVPPGVRVVNRTTAIMGGTTLNGTDAVTDPRAPTVMLTGTCLFGGITVEQVKRGEKKRSGC
ncbi:DUF1707 and DUF2154 domain-containing protein [Spiractinospora alimapuensis]|nr:DUF1707 and DUF2154 domain-containing protein [Spiractinospora alimapuensis]